jgi:phage gpG-like protein
MQVIRDDWSPLFQSLKDKISADARRELLFRMINDLRYVTQMNFGESGMARPETWQILSPKYAREFKKGNRTPTLMLKGDLIRGFKTTFDSNSASLTNDVAYADEHQFGVGYKNLPARPFYPINEDGSLTDFAENRQLEIVREHFSQ